MWRHLPTPRNNRNNNKAALNESSLSLSSHSSALSPLPISVCLPAPPAMRRLIKHASVSCTPLTEWERETKRGRQSVSMSRGACCCCCSVCNWFWIGNKGSIFCFSFLFYLIFLFVICLQLFNVKVNLFLAINPRQPLSKSCAHWPSCHCGPFACLCMPLHSVALHAQLGEPTGGTGFSMYVYVHATL